MLPLLVTVAYVPPVRRLCIELRKSAFSAIPLIVKWVGELRRGSQHIILAHVNAADGCADLKTNLASVLSSKSVEELPLVDAGDDPMGHGMWFVRTEDGVVLHRRDDIESISMWTVAGKSFST